MIVVGDISFSRGVERVIKAQKDINYLFLKIQDYLNSGDIVFGNLETPITNGREILDYEMVFRSNPGTERSLKRAGFTILSLANNHTPDFGQEGLLDTFNYLEQEGIDYVGAGKNRQEAYQPAYIESEGIRFAFLAYNDQNLVPQSYGAEENHAGTTFMDIGEMTKAIAEARQKADLVIVSMHSGVEYADEPTTTQTNFARAAIDAGADLVVGHHPHVVQTMEKYKGKFIFYSLGNFVFDQMWSRETRGGLMAKLYFTKNGVSKISFLPVMIENFSQPRVANDKEAEEILQRLKFPLAERLAYFWNSDENNFEKTFRSVIYDRALGTETIASKEVFKDLDNNSIRENYILANGRLTVVENSQHIWQSPKDWWIDNFVLADSTNDGVIDINLSVWKSGSYGDFKPFWIKEEDLSVKNHFFIFNLRDKKIKPVWQSSNLVDQNQELTIAGVDDDNGNELVVIEKDYLVKGERKDNYIAVWKWNGWGFTNEWRSEKGNFCNLEIEKIDGRNYIVADSL